MIEQLKPWEVAKMIDEAGGPVELVVWYDGFVGPAKKMIRRVDFNGVDSLYTFEDTDGYWWHNSRLPQENKEYKPIPKEWENVLAKYRAVDSDGQLYEYSKAPYIRKGEWVVDGPECVLMAFISDGHDPTNWKESLEERPKKIRPMTQREVALFIMDGKKALKKRSWADQEWIISSAWGIVGSIDCWQWADLEDHNFPQWCEFPMVEG